MICYNLSRGLNSSNIEYVADSIDRAVRSKLWRENSFLSYFAFGEFFLPFLSRVSKTRWKWKEEMGRWWHVVLKRDCCCFDYSTYIHTVGCSHICVLYKENQEMKIIIHIYWGRKLDMNWSQDLHHTTILGSWVVVLWNHLAGSLEVVQVEHYDICGLFSCFNVQLDRMGSTKHLCYPIFNTHMCRRWCHRCFQVWIPKICSGKNMHYIMCSAAIIDTNKELERYGSSELFVVHRGSTIQITKYSCADWCGSCLHRVECRSFEWLEWLPRFGKGGMRQEREIEIEIDR